MKNIKDGDEKLKDYKEYVKKRLGELIPVLQKAATGDFSGIIKILKKEDEFSELFVGLSLMMDDLKELEKMRNKIEEERRERLIELEQWKKLMVGRELKMAQLKEEIEKITKEIQTLKADPDDKI